ncbi:alpha-glucosidase [Virgibacillus profundi]|uniref:Alpha-glucosidase n=1 Tax=Virgibacillus profundi TaxID=2024555 RepID=A0A2A2II38_9BACI|nr:glycoside hydrolase family 31 protein [Virgibacillus profundi]PAV30966.1 alpha-glucosidase [Virgibacillus profundi]PXY55150.1 glycoside hydrolase family 31 protein [Virgibacillus profundi]
MLGDTSFAIHPGKEKQSAAVVYRDIGNIISNKKTDDTYLFVCVNGSVAVQFYSDSIVRITMNQKGDPKIDQSQTVMKKPDNVAITEDFSKDIYTLKTSKIKLVIYKAPFRLIVKDENGQIIVSESDRGMAFRENGEVTVFKKMHENDHFYGFGEKSGFLDKRGEKYEMWNTDVYAPHNPETDPLYESIPYFMTLRAGKAHGVFFDNTFRTVFDMKSESDYYSFSAEGGQMDYYVMAGPEPKDVLEQYTHLTGRMPIPPKWALGYHQSRYSYETEAEVRELAKIFVERDIPVDVIHLDIHYMNGYRVFTFDKERFPNPKKLIADLKEMGIRIVPIVDPGVKKDSEYTIYQEGVNQDQFCKYIEGETYFGEVWPGISAFPDFTDEKVRKWWGEKHAFYTDMGIEGIWNDMNEPAVFNESKTMDVSVMHRNDGNPTTHRELHNVYGYLMGQATYEGMKEQLQGKRPFLLTRAGYAGVQRYASVWTGDNRSFWEHLQMSLPMVMNLGLSGVPFTGPDVGGFAHDTNAELLTRWMQVGAFTPYFRNHSALDTVNQEPWQFGEKYEAIMKKYIQMRYEWMPQLYSLFYQASISGLPVMRPLLMEFPEDEKTYNLNDQFMIGDNVVVAPILAPAITDRAVYLPKGEWVEFSTGEVYDGEKTHLIHAELEDMPIFVKKGTTVMQGEWISNKDKVAKNIQMNIYAGDSGETYRFTYYDDDGETFDYENDSYMELDIEVVSKTDAIELKVLNQKGNFSPTYKEIDVNVIGLKKTQKVIIDGKISRENNYKISI